jgi:hypothetical protein
VTLQVIRKDASPVEVPESDYGQLTTLHSVRAYLSARVPR